MTKLIKYDANKLQRIGYNVSESGDGVWFFVVGGFISVAGAVCGIPAAFLVDPLFSILLLPVLFYVTMLAGWSSGSIEVGYYGGDNSYEKALKLMPKLKGTFVEQYAIPVMEQIYSHTVDGHPGNKNSSIYSCSLCSERLKVLNELVPNKPTDKSDIEQAKLFIQNRKQFELDA